MTRAFALGSVLAGSVLGLVLNAHAAAPLPTHDDWGIPYTAYQRDAMKLAHAGAYGPLACSDRDCHVTVERLAGVAHARDVGVNLEFLPCIGHAGTRWFEDGTAAHGTCPYVEPWQTARIAAVRAHVESLGS